MHRKLTVAIVAWKKSTEGSFELAAGNVNVEFPALDESLIEPHCPIWKVYINNIGGHRLK